MGVPPGRNVATIVVAWPPGHNLPPRAGRRYGEGAAVPPAAPAVRVGYAYAPHLAESRGLPPGFPHPRLSPEGESRGASGAGRGRTYGAAAAWSMVRRADFR